MILKKPRDIIQFNKKERQQKREGEGGREEEMMRKITLVSINTIPLAPLLSIACLCMTLLASCSKDLNVFTK